MEKILFTATVDSHILKFHIPFIKWFRDNGYEVHVASNGESKIPYVNKKFNVPFQRSPFKTINYKAYKELKRILSLNKYKIIHCHTPVGSVLTRIAARNERKFDTKVLYTAHGFHFYEGGPLKNWLIFYPIEKWLSKYTDCLITINSEDYNLAIKKFNIKSIYLVNGVGIDLKKFKPQTNDIKSSLRNKYGFNDNQFILIYVGELSYRKHQDMLINTLPLLKNDIPNLKLLLVGNGDYLKRYKQLVKKLDLNECVEFLGYRNDINNLMLLSDIAVSTSRQEGLPVNIMEAMASGLPVVVTNCRGNKDMIINGKNGFVIQNDDLKELSSAIKKLYNASDLSESFKVNNITNVQQYSVEKILKDMEKIYSNFL